MSLRWDRILDRIWLTLSGAGLIALTLQFGVHLGGRRWSIDAAPPAQAAVPEQTVRVTGCRTLRAPR